MESHYRKGQTKDKAKSMRTFCGKDVEIKDNAKTRQQNENENENLYFSFSLKQHLVKCWKPRALQLKHVSMLWCLEMGHKHWQRGGVRDTKWYKRKG